MTGKLNDYLMCVLNVQQRKFPLLLAHLLSQQLHGVGVIVPIIQAAEQR